MKMIEIGRLCLKIAGRDAGKICAIIEKIDDNYVMVDGETRRKKCNINHLEFLDKTISIKQNAENSEVVKALKELGIETKEKAEKQKKQAVERPKKQKKQNKSSEDQAKSQDTKKQEKPVEKPKTETKQ